MACPSDPADDAEARDWLDLMAEADAEVEDLEFPIDCDACGQQSCDGSCMRGGMQWDESE